MSKRKQFRYAARYMNNRVPRLDRRRLRAVILTRCSSPKQKRVEGEFGSIAGQRTVCRRYIDSHGWDYIREYTDEAEQGDEVDRDGLNQLLEDARAGLFDVAIVSRQSRLMRTVVGILSVVSELEALGVQIFEATGRHISLLTASDLLSTVVQAGIDQIELKGIRDRVNDQRLERAIAGYWQGSRPPFGYRTEQVANKFGKKGRMLVLKVNKSSAAHLRELYARIIGGEAPGEIMADFERRGVRTPSFRVRRGHKRVEIGRLPLNWQHLADIFSNPVYKKCVVVPEFSRYKDCTEKPIVINDDGSAVFPGKHERLVSDEDWDAGYDAFFLRPRNPRKPREADKTARSLVQGIIETVDGATITPSWSNRSGYYIPVKRRRTNDADPQSWRLPVQATDACVLAILTRVLSTPQIENEVLCASDNADEPKKFSKELSILRKRLDRLKTQETRVIDVIARCKSLAAQKALAVALDEVKHQQHQADRELEALWARRMPGARTAAELRTKIRDGIRDFVQNADHMDRRDLKELIRTFIARVVVSCVKVRAKHDVEYAISVHLKYPQLMPAGHGRGRLTGKLRVMGRECEITTDHTERRQCFIAQHAVADAPAHHPLRKLEAYTSALKADDSLTATALAKRLNKSKGHVSQVLGFAQIAPKLRKLILRHYRLFSHNDLLRLAKMPPYMADIEVKSVLGKN